MRHTFTYTHHKQYKKTPQYKCTVQTDAESLSEILQAMEDYLKGCGFFLDGNLSIEPEDDTSDIDDQ